MQRRRFLHCRLFLLTDSWKRLETLWQTMLVSYVFFAAFSKTDMKTQKKYIHQKIPTIDLGSRTQRSHLQMNQDKSPKNSAQSPQIRHKIRKHINAGNQTWQWNIQSLRMEVLMGQSWGIFHSHWEIYEQISYKVATLSYFLKLVNPH